MSPMENCCFGIGSLIALRCFWLGDVRPLELINPRLVYKNMPRRLGGGHLYRLCQFHLVQLFNKSG